MKPLFADRNRIVPNESTGTRFKYKINQDCKYFSAQIHNAGGKNVDGDHYQVPISEINQRVLDEWEIIGKSVNVQRNGQQVTLDLDKTLYQTLYSVSSQSGKGLAAVCLEAPGIFDHISTLVKEQTTAAPKTAHSYRGQDVRDISRVGREFEKWICPLRIEHHDTETAERHVPENRHADLPAVEG